MSTVVKAVVGAVLIVGGVLLGQPELVLAGAALEVGAVGDLLSPHPPQSGEQIKWKADPYAGLPLVLGRTLTAGNIVYRRGHGANNKYETFITILSLGPVQSIDTNFLNRTTVIYNGDGSAQGTYNGLVWQRSQLGAQPEASYLAPPVDSPPGWTSTHKLSGKAATLLTFAYNASGNNGLTSEPSPGWIVHGIFCYDPRLDSTYPGGAGACRWGQPATYVWSQNPHIHALNWCFGIWQNGVRVAGIGAPARAVDIAAFVEGANLDDARAWTIGGVVYTRPDTPWNTLKLMLQAGGSQPVMVGGVISCINQAPRVSLATITRQDIVGDCTLSANAPRRQRLNGVIPQYRSEANDWNIVAASGIYVSSYVTADGDERTKEITYALVQDVNQAAQLARYDIENSREAGPGTVPVKPPWLNYRIGDCVTFSPEDGFSLKCIITGRAIDAATGKVTLTLRGETDAKHGYALGTTGTAPPAAGLTYDTSVAAPALSDWTLTGTALTASSTSLPALNLVGAVGNASADAVIFDYRVHVDGAGSNDNWINLSTELPSVTAKQITSVTPSTSYEVSVRYRVRGITGARLILGPVTAGALSVPSAATAISATTALSATTASSAGHATDYVGNYL